MDTKKWIVFGLLCAGVLASLVWMNQGSQVDVDTVDSKQSQPASQQSGDIADHTKGANSNAPTLVEYGDFQCPGCKSAAETINAVAEDYDDKISFVFRNFPLTSIHSNAYAASAAAEAAGLQDKFWEMHDLLYAQQNQWEGASPADRTELFSSYATQLKLDIDAFKRDLDNGRVKSKIAFDQALGRKSSVTGTPSFFFDGEKLSDDITNDVITGNGDKLREFLDEKTK